jgi:hypothetical protein
MGRWGRGDVEDEEWRRKEEEEDGEWRIKRAGREGGAWLTADS